MKTLGFKEWVLFSAPPLLMGVGIGLSFAANPYSLYFFLIGVALEIPILYLVYKHK